RWLPVAELRLEPPEALQQAMGLLALGGIQIAKPRLDVAEALTGDVHGGPERRAGALVVARIATGRGDDFMDLDAIIGREHVGDLPRRGDLSDPRQRLGHLPGRILVSIALDRFDDPGGLLGGEPDPGRATPRDLQGAAIKADPRVPIQ